MNENKRSVLPADISAVDASHCYLIDLVRRLKGDNRTNIILECRIQQTVKSLRQEL